MWPDASATLSIGMAAEGFAQTSNRLGDCLEILCTASEHRALPEQRAARLECLQVRPLHGGRRLRYWRPLGSQVPAPADTPPSRSGRVALLVDRATRLLGWPVAAGEIKTWHQWRPDDPVFNGVEDVLAKGRIGAQIRGVTSADVRRRRGRLVNASAPFACDGGAPYRVATVNSPADALTVGRLLDSCYVVDPLREWALLDRLRWDADAHDARALAYLADVREAVVARELTRAAAPPSSDTDDGFVPVDPGEWARLAQALDDGVARIESWWERPAEEKPARAPGWARNTIETRDVIGMIASGDRELQDARHADAARSVSTLLTGTPRAALRGVRSLEPLVAELRRLEGNPTRHARPYLTSVRRLPNPAVGRGRLHEDHAEPFSLLDVGDALASLARITSRGRICHLLEYATLLLGSVVRDARLLRWVVDRMPPEADAHRQGGIVALGALGALTDATTLRAVLGDWIDASVLEAAALAVGVTPVAADDRAQLLAALAPLVDPAHEGWLMERAERAMEGAAMTLPL